MDAFLSYSGRTQRDRDFAHGLLVRLNQQPDMDVWIFAKRGEGIAAGEPIMEACLSRVRLASAFIAVISDSSLDSTACQKECECALQQSSLGECRSIPIITTGRAERDWPPVFRKLLSLKAIDCRDKTPDLVERCLREICRTFHVEYVPPDDAVRRLPVVKRLTRELRGLSASDSSDEAGRLETVIRLANRCSRQYKSGAIEQCYATAQVMVDELEEQYDRDGLYYPYVLLGVLDIELGRLDQAERRFSALLDHARRDENVYGALGYIASCQDRAEAALAWYSEADAVCSDGDSAILFNLVLTKLECDIPLEEAEIDRVLSDPTVTVTHPDELVRLEFLQAIFLLYKGKVSEACRVLASIDIRSAPTDLIVEVVDRLHELRHSNESCHFAPFGLRILDRSENLAPCLLHRSARYRFELGDPAGACRRLEALVGSCPKNVQYLVELSLCYLATNAYYAFERTSERAVDVVLFSEVDGMLDEASYHYYHGFGHFLRGNESAARAAFSRSARPDTEWYAKVLAGIGFEPGREN